MRAVRDTGGAYIEVSDQEILDAIPVLAREAGVFAEPAGAASHAGLVKAVNQGLVSPEEHIVVLVTGNGLKDVASAMKVAGQGSVIEPTLDAVRQVISK